MYTGPNIITDGLVLYLDAANRKSYTGIGTAWNDLSGKNNNATLTNGPTFSSADRGSILFDGVNDYVEIPSSNTYKVQFPVSICIWFKIVSFNNYTGATLIETDNPTNSYHSGITLYVTNTYSIATDYGNNTQNNSPGRRTYSTSTNQFSLNSWNYVVITHITNSVCQCFLNGYSIPINYTSGTGNTLVYSQSPLTLGFSYDVVASRFLNGNIPQVAIYNRALTAAEVLQNYNATKSRFNL